MASGRMAIYRSERALGRSRSRHLLGGAGSRRALGGTMAQLSYDVGLWLYVLVLLCMVGLVAFLSLAQTTSVAKQVERMESLEGELRQLKWDNNALLLQIVQYQQMLRIQQQARAMGLSEAEDIEYVEVVLDQPDTSSGGDIAQDSPSSLPMGSSPLPVWLRHVVRQFAEWAAGGTARAEQLEQ